MLVTLLHSSKTMRPSMSTETAHTKPQFISKTKLLARHIQALSISEIMTIMKVSEKIAVDVCKNYSDWSTSSTRQRPAIDAFLGDIYSGFQVQTLSESDRVFANKHLRILSGLYGILRPLDGIMPYRLEMAYPLSFSQSRNLYEFWGSSIAETLSEYTDIVDLSAIEYSKTITPYIRHQTIVRPKFLTYDPKTNQSKFVVVHAKIARGAYAHWMITNRVSSTDALNEFNQLGYQYDPVLSTRHEPVFVCQQFQGLGLSVRGT